MMIRSIVAGKVYRYPKIVVNMTDRDIIDRVSAMFGTSTYLMPKVLHPRGRKQAYRAQVGGTRAAEWMEILRPWMGERRTQRIDEVLREYGAIKSTEIRRRRACQVAAARRQRHPVTGKFLANSAPGA